MPLDRRLWLRGRFTCKTTPGAKARNTERKRETARGEGTVINTQTPSHQSAAELCLMHNTPLDYSIMQ